MSDAAAGHGSPPLVIVLMGVSGSGKSTVGRLLADELGWRFFDADDEHLPENIERMKRGEALGEIDRGPWLDALASRVRRRLDAGEPAVLACSALTERSREVLSSGDRRVRFVHLTGPRELIRSRMECREHFMPPALLESQFRTLEPPHEALEVDVTKPPEQLAADIRRALAVARG